MSVEQYVCQYRLRIEKCSAFLRHLKAYEGDLVVKTFDSSNPKLQLIPSSVSVCTQSLYGEVYKWVSRIQLWTWPEYPEGILWFGGDEMKCSD